MNSKKGIQTFTFTNQSFMLNRMQGWELSSLMEFMSRAENTRSVYAKSIQNTRCEQTLCLRK
jgi:hypothetical protein